MTTKPATLLFIDDDQSLQMMAKHSLGTQYNFISALSGESGLQILEKTAVDIILLDIEMPGINGLQTCHAIRNHPIANNIPVLMITSHNDFATINTAYDIGITDFITKPLNWHLLYHRVRYLLRMETALNHLKTNDSKLRNVQRIAALGTWEWNTSTQQVSFSEQAYQLFGWEPGTDISSAQFIDSIHPDDKQDFINMIDEVSDQEYPDSFKIEHRIIRPDGSERYVFQQGEILYNKLHKASWITAAVQDISERKRAEQRIHELAYFDSLTGLPNREQFKEALNQSVALMRRQQGILALLFLDLDKFKRINDTFGHDIGDLLLKEVAERLQLSVRASDRVCRNYPSVQDTSVCRLGGDEFTIMLSDLQSADNAATIAERIIHALNQPFLIAGHEMYVTPSIGISIFKQDGDNAETLLKNADTAMYHAKNKGRNNFQYYSESMNLRTLQRLKMETKLRTALTAGEFEVLYQPVVNLQSNTIFCAEALLRWHNDELGDISPTEFIPIAEDIGVMLKIGHWVIEQACQQLQEWQQQGLAVIPLSVNLSAIQFNHPDLIKDLSGILQKYAMNPADLTLELTETVTMGQKEEAITILQNLKQLGVSLSVDDFGTGYSSLVHLKRFPIDSVKIDRSIINQVLVNEDDAEICDAIIAMSQRLNLIVIAEGVETEQQSTFLVRRNCEIAQGYLFSVPLNITDLTQFLNIQRAPEQRKIANSA